MQPYLFQLQLPVQSCSYFFNRPVLEMQSLPHNKKVPENRPITARGRVENAANHEREAVSNECNARGVSQSVQEAQKPDA